MLSEDIPANDVRLPEPVAGTALRVTRYGQVRAVVVHPEDFDIIETLIDAYRHLHARVGDAAVAEDLAAETFVRAFAARAPSATRAMVCGRGCSRSRPTCCATSCAPASAARAGAHPR